MEITVEAYGALRDDIGGERTTRVDVDEPADVAAVIQTLGIEPRAVFQVLVNEEQAARTKELSEGDTVTLMPPFTGG